MNKSLTGEKMTDERDKTTAAAREFLRTEKPTMFMSPNRDAITQQMADFAIQFHLEQQTEAVRGKSQTIGGYVLLNANGDPFWQSFRRNRYQVWEVFTYPWAQTHSYERAMELKVKWESEGCRIAACRIDLFPIADELEVGKADAATGTREDR